MIAEKITVRIDVADGENGSGVIIGKQGNTYYVATACHVVSESGYGRKCTTEHLRDSFTLTTPDGEKYFLKSAANQIIILNPDFDVAVVKFTSDKTYQVAELGDYQLEDNQGLFVSGFPGQDSNKQRRFTAGRVRDKDISTFAAKDQFSLSYGNELVYTNLSFGGMSGGAVLDTQGRVVGINTGSEDEVFTSSDRNDKEVSLGFSLGIPMTTFLGLASQGKVPTESLRIISTPPKESSDAESQQIKAQLFIFRKPSKDSNALDWLNYGNELWRAYQTKEAVAAFNQAIQQLEKNGDKKILAKAYYAKGLTLWHGGGYQEALEAFKQATVNDSRFYQAWRYQGSSLKYLQQYDQALSAYQQAIDNSDKKDFTLYVEQGDVLRELTLYQEALASYQQAINLKAKHPWAYFNRGFIFYKQKKWDLALADYNQAIALNPKLTGVYNNRGVLYAEKKKWDLALVDYNQAIALNPKYAEAYNDRGLLYFNKKKLDLALSDYNQAIVFNPKYAEAYHNRGVLYGEQKKLDLALADFNKAIAINPAYALAYKNRGLLYFNQQKLDLALADYNQAITINSRLAEAYHNRGIIYTGQKKWDLALSDYNQAININPEFAPTYYNRGNLRFSQGKSDLAISDYTQSLIFDPKFTNAYYNRGTVYLQMGNKQAAIEDFQKVAQLLQEQGDTEGYKQMIETLRQLGVQ